MAHPHFDTTSASSLNKMPRTRVPVMRRWHRSTAAAPCGETKNGDPRLGWQKFEDSDRDGLALAPGELQWTLGGKDLPHEFILRQCVHAITEVLDRLQKYGCLVRVERLPTAITTERYHCAHAWAARVDPLAHTVPDPERTSCGNCDDKSCLSRSSLPLTSDPQAERTRQVNSSQLEEDSVARSF